MQALNELVQFLKSETRIDVKSLALHSVLSMTGNFESRMLLLTHTSVLTNVIELAFAEKEQKSVNKDAFFTLINLSADELDSKVLIDKHSTLVSRLLDYVLCESSRFSDTACAILSNLSRGKRNSETIFDKYFNDQKADPNTDPTNKLVNFEKLLKVFCTENFNPSNKLDYLAPFICNLTQLESVRNIILSDKLVLLRLLPYTTYSRSTLRRGGIVGTLKNCCFNYDYHDMLLFSDDIDLLSRLLLPLAGPEEFDDDDMEKLPLDLQYLPPAKERESDPDIRIMLIETILMLCSHKKCRLYVKEKNAYVILRELHTWEKEDKVILTLEKLIHLLIADEPNDSELENLHQVVVPDDLAKKFYEFDKQDLEKNFE